MMSLEKVSTFFAAIVFSAVMMNAGVASAYTGQELASKAKITLDQARVIVLKARPGTVTDQELEQEKGGSGLRYSFDIKNGKTVYEVGVDAQSGKLLENAAEGAHPD